MFGKRQLAKVQFSSQRQSAHLHFTLCMHYLYSCCLLCTLHSSWFIYPFTNVHWQQQLRMVMLVDHRAVYNDQVVRTSLHFASAISVLVYLILNVNAFSCRLWLQMWKHVLQHPPVHRHSQVHLWLQSGCYRKDQERKPCYCWREDPEDLKLVRAGK